MYIQILTSAIFIATSIYGGPTGEAEKTKDSTLKDVKQIAKEKVLKTDVTVGPDTLETYVREYFTDTPVLAEIARCESEFRHIGTNGQIIRGKVNQSDIGVMQINEYYHTKPSKALGYDLYDLEGNLEYAKWLYDEFGTSPWNASKACWGSGTKVAKS